MKSSVCSSLLVFAALVTGCAKTETAELQWSVPGEGKAQGAISGLVNTVTLNVEHPEKTMPGVVKVPVSKLVAKDENLTRQLQSAQWLNAAVYPEIVFELESISDEGDGRWEALGHVRLCGRRTKISFPFQFEKVSDTEARIISHLALQPKNLLPIKGDQDIQVLLDFNFLVRAK